MHQHVSHVFARLDRSRAALREAVDAVPPDMRNTRPAPERWSVSEVVEHLSLVERRFAALLTERIREARSAGLGPERGARIPLPSSIEATIADRRERRTAPDTVRPHQGITHTDAWSAVERARGNLRATISAADGLALSTVTHAHPLFGTLDVYQWVELIAGHEARHTEQIREIAVVAGRA